MYLKLMKKKVCKRTVAFKFFNYIIEKRIIIMKKMKFIKSLPVLMLGVLLMVPATVNAGSKYLSMTMYDSSKSISATCPIASFKGGAMAGGAGIKYTITVKGVEVKSGSCNPNTSFSKACSSPTGYSVTMKLKETQKKKSDPGIGWGRMDY